MCWLCDVSRVTYWDAVADCVHHKGRDKQHGTVEAGAGWDDVPLSVLLLVCLLDGLVVLCLLVKIFVEKEVPVNNTEIVDHQQT